MRNLAFALLGAARPPRPALAADGPQKPLGDVPILHEEAAAAGLSQRLRRSVGILCRRRRRGV